MSQASPSDHHTGGQQPPLSGRKVVLAGLVCGATGLTIAMFLRAIVANTTVRLSSRELFWSTVLMGGFGVAAGMALASVRQLQRHNPDPEYHRANRSVGRLATRHRKERR
jgi:hypothetical protein